MVLHATMLKSSNNSHTLGYTVSKYLSWAFIQRPVSISLLSLVHNNYQGEKGVLNSGLKQTIGCYRIIRARFWTYLIRKCTEIYQAPWEHSPLNAQPNSGKDMRIGMPPKRECLSGIMVSLFLPLSNLYLHHSIFRHPLFFCWDSWVVLNPIRALYPTLCQTSG